MQLTKKANRASFLTGSNLLPMFVLATLGIQGIVFLILVANTFGINRLAQKPPPEMVQMVDGRSNLMQPINHLDRTPEVVRRFVKDGLALMFTWNGKLSAKPSDDAPSPTPARAMIDPGVTVGSRGKVTTGSWQASFTLSEDFRAKFLATVATLTPNEVFSGNAQSVLSFESISEPKQISPHTWQVDVVANLMIFDGNHPEGLAIPFNKSVFVNAIEPTTDPLDTQTTPIQQAVYRMKQSGLQITEMRDLDIQQMNH